MRWRSAAEPVKASGRRTRSVIITDTEHVILSSLQTETIAKRLSGGDTDDGEEVDE